MSIRTVRGDLAGMAEELEEWIVEDNIAVARVMNFIVQSTAQRAKHKIRSGGRSGRFYFNGTHQASAPGEPPASLTGELANSIHFTKVGQLLNSTADLSVDADYANTLEHGGFNESGKYIEPRPFIAPSLAEAMKAADAKFTKEMGG